MSAPRLDAILHGRPGLVVHVGAGADGHGALARSARAAVLIEPDPERAAQLRAACASLPSVRLIEAELAPEAGCADLRPALHALTNGAAIAGAPDLARDPSGDVESCVDCVAPGDILAQDDFEGGGENILLIDAGSDALAVLRALDAAGWLERFDHVITRVSETAQHAGVPARADVEAWARAQGRLMLALPGDGGRDLWRAWISPVRRGARIASPADALTGHAARAEELETALETYRAAAREAEARWLEQRSALLKELQASQERCARLEAGAQADGGGSDGGLDAAGPEAAGAETRTRALRAELKAELEVLRKRAMEMSRALQHAEAARTRAEEELKIARKGAGDAGAQQAADSGAVVRFQREIERLQQAIGAGAERERALAAQIQAAREDLRLAIRGQRLAQASLSELQARYGVLLDDRNALDGLLRQLTDRLASAANARFGVDHQDVQTDWDT